MEKLGKEQQLFMQVNFAASVREDWISARADKEALDKGLFRGMC